MTKRIAMLGAGSGFTDEITKGLCACDLLRDSAFVLMDIDEGRLAQALDGNRKIAEDAGAPLELIGTTDQREALDGCDYVVTSCEAKRVSYWIRDIEIPKPHGVHQFKGENGGPGGQAHAMRNITMFMSICGDMAELCPDAWLMNFTNPMSFLCTYFRQYTNLKALGFCHQVHGSMGVAAEMLGLEPDAFEVISGGVNHFNWMLDLRLKSTGESYMDRFMQAVPKNEYWQKIHPDIPAQKFTLDMLETFGLYPIGYDDHIVEYLPFFYDHTEWESVGYHLPIDELREQEATAADQTMVRHEFHDFPFPKDGSHPHYDEQPTEVMEALESGERLYMDALNIPNRGAIDNLPHDAIVDVPAIITGGEARGVHVGPLPAFARELCRRQIAIHELLTEATVEGDRGKVVQSMALDPWVRHIRQARDITDAFLDAYRAELPQFWA